MKITVIDEARKIIREVELCLQFGSELCFSGRNFKTRLILSGAVHGASDSKDI